jgi:hypothetical protein
MPIAPITIAGTGDHDELDRLNTIKRRCKLVRQVPTGLSEQGLDVRAGPTAVAISDKCKPHGIRASEFLYDPAFRE